MAPLGLSWIISLIQYLNFGILVTKYLVYCHFNIQKEIARTHNIIARVEQSVFIMKKLSFINTSEIRLSFPMGRKNEKKWYLLIPVFRIVHKKQLSFSIDAISPLHLLLSFILLTQGSFQINLFYLMNGKCNNLINTY